MNAAQGILLAISEEFEVDIVSEHEPEFYGYETKEELDAVWAAMAAKHEQEFYDEVVKFVRGDSHDVVPGTIGMIKAEIAKRLVAETPELLGEDKRPDLIKAVKMIYDRDHLVVVKLTEEEEAFVGMVATHEDDLSQA